MLALSIIETFLGVCKVVYVEEGKQRGPLSV